MGCVVAFDDGYAMPAVPNRVQDAYWRSCRWNPSHKPVGGSAGCEDIKLATTTAAPFAAAHIDDCFVFAIAVQVNEGVRKNGLIVVGLMEPRINLSDVVLKEPLQNRRLGV